MFFARIRKKFVMFCGRVERITNCVVRASVLCAGLPPRTPGDRTSFFAFGPRKDKEETCGRRAGSGDPRTTRCAGIDPTLCADLPTPHRTRLQVSSYRCLPRFSRQGLPEWLYSRAGFWLTPVRLLRHFLVPLFHCNGTRCESDCGFVAIRELPGCSR